MSDAMRTASSSERNAGPVRAWEAPAREAASAGSTAPDDGDAADELAAVAVLSTN